ncbi:MAG: ATP-binding protein, partial [bacterium]
SHIREACGRAAGLTGQLLLFSRRRAASFEPVDLNKIISNLLKMLEWPVSEGYSIVADLADSLWAVNANTVDIKQVITNMIANARDGMPEGGEIIIRTENAEITEKDCMRYGFARHGKFVRLSFKDKGVGMDSTTVARIFEPFFTTRGSGKGAGLRLSVVYGIVKQHQGWVNVDSLPGKGTTFTVYLPATSKRAENLSQRVGPGSRYGGKGERILVVEDEEEVRQLTDSIFRENGYVVFAASNAKEALDIFHREKGNLQMVFSDVMLPDGSGIQLVERLTALNPAIRALFSSGYTDGSAGLEAIQEKGYSFLQKPYVLSYLLRAARELLERRRTRLDQER